MMHFCKQSSTVGASLEKIKHFQLITSSVKVLNLKSASTFRQILTVLILFCRATSTTPTHRDKSMQTAVWLHLINDGDYNGSNDNRGDDMRWSWW